MARRSWFEEGKAVDAEDDAPTSGRSPARSIERLESWQRAIEDGIIEPHEVAEQKDRLVALLRELEPMLDDAQHEGSPACSRSGPCSRPCTARCSSRSSRTEARHDRCSAGGRRAGTMKARAYRSRSADLMQVATLIHADLARRLRRPHHTRASATRRGPRRRGPTSAGRLATKHRSRRPC